MEVAWFLRTRATVVRVENGWCRTGDGRFFLRMPELRKNLLSALPADLGPEVFEEVLRAESVRIERIVSRGHTSPESGWYDQDEHEWVLVLEGAAVLAFDDGSEVRLGAGDHVNLPAHRRHRVAWTAPEKATVWLAVFYR